MIFINLDLITYIYDEKVWVTLGKYKTRVSIVVYETKQRFDPLELVHLL